jgi:hypothetical protein
MTAYPIDQTTLTVSGGTFTTKCDTISTAGYLHRGIVINRSNTTLMNCTHAISGERSVSTGASYIGFFTIDKAYNATLQDCNVMAQKAVSWGTYELWCARSIKANLTRVIQTNDIQDKTKFGVIDTDYCKSLTLDGCRLNRFDDHLGIQNVNILNSSIGYDGINLVGGGLFYMKNTTVTAYFMISLRPDYGTVWDGDITVEDCTYNSIFTSDSYGRLVASFWGGNYYGTGNFGYPSMLPHNVTFTRLTVSKSGGSLSKLYVFADFLGKTYNPNGPYPLGKPQTATISGITGISLSNIAIAAMGDKVNKTFFSDPSIVFNKS